MRELNRFDHVGPDEIALQSQLVSQAHGPGTMRSGRGYKDLDVNRVGKCRYLGLARIRQAGLPLRDHHNIFDD